MLTKGSFTLDEWNHHLRLLNIMDFSMFSCNHFNNFLSGPIREQSAMSKRGQEGTSEESSPMAKPRPMKSAIAKPRPVNLVSDSLWSKRNNSWQHLSDSNNQVNTRVEQGGVPSSVGELTRDTSQHSAEQSQVRQRTQAVSGNGCEVWRHTRTGQRLSFTTCKSQTIGTGTKVFQNLQKKLGNNENSSHFPIEATKTNVLMWRLFLSSAMKAPIHLGPNYSENLKVFKNTNFEEIQSVFGITQRLISEHSEEIFNVKPIESAASSWTSWSSDQVDKSKNTCFFRFCSMLGEDVRAQRCN